ncbi:MAG: hypothetical protein JRH16_20115 [Deltaproteobacteria bacterium]|nr:hypothetical protein [Deltaproteobacteria bacterium]
MTVLRSAVPAATLCVAFWGWTAMVPLLAHAEGSESDLTVTGPAAEPAPEAESSDPPPEDVALDRLLQLPTGMSFDGDRRRGASEAQWRSRFRESRAAIQAAEQSLAIARGELEEASGGAGGGQWQMAPPGSNNTENSPVSFKLREQIRSGKEQVDAAQRQHRELEVEADLADVPQSWRKSS